MAIGLARLFGFHYMENFNYPYISRSATEFWRRWHISLGSFFRDYVYIPMGGNRRHQFWNLLVVWFFDWIVARGQLEFCTVGDVFRHAGHFGKMVSAADPQKLPRFFSHLYLIFAVVIGWALFYFTDLNRLWRFCRPCLGWLARGYGMSSWRSCC